MKTTCAFCESVSVMEPEIGKELDRKIGAAWLGVFSCHHCDGYMIAYGYLSPSQISNHGRPREIFAGLEMAERIGKFAWHPANAFAPEFIGLPPNIEIAASEVHISLGNGQIIAAAITARATLEAIIKDQGIVDNMRLAQKIGKMQETGSITKLLTDQAHSIRLVGNDMAHGDFDMLPDREEVEHIVEFMDALIDTLYVQPAKLEAAQAKRATRKE
ncbi:hypothetical protein CXR25_13970 [Brevibacterium aurantiacum]|uniref:DUF4145 domain-containing protein n=1 Tax=Brevibacterium aurantiacum TaxID=273384 RepID=UPI000F64DCC0|nr:DUF4145 domain-containing protein [Brevibacterium aurantiacum]AZL13803.1 hypothetical protein CXR25_13970 [Brevibacterium aurantiacum]